MASEGNTARVRIGGRIVRVGTSRSGRQSTGPSQQRSSCLQSGADAALEATRSNREIQPLEEPAQPCTESITTATKVPSECSNPTSATSLVKTTPEIKDKISPDIKDKTIPEIVECLTVAQSVLEGSASKNEPSIAFVVCLLTDVLNGIQGYGHEQDQKQVN
jgi:hypothetical protein